MKDSERLNISQEVAEYDERVALGIVHERGYAIKMEQYRLSLVG